MKKNLLILLTGIIFGTSIGVGASYVFNASDVEYSPSDESWEVNNASDALNGLKEDLNNMKTDVDNYKDNIVGALQDKGLDIDDTSSMESIVNSIADMGIGDNVTQIIDTSVGGWPGNTSGKTLTASYTTEKKALYIVKIKAVVGQNISITGPSNLTHLGSNLYVGILDANQVISARISGTQFYDAQGYSIFGIMIS